MLGNLLNLRNSGVTKPFKPGVFEMAGEIDVLLSRYRSFERALREKVVDVEILDGCFRFSGEGDSAFSNGETRLGESLGERLEKLKAMEGLNYVQVLEKALRLRRGSYWVEWIQNYDNGNNGCTNCRSRRKSGPITGC